MQMQEYGFTEFTSELADIIKSLQVNKQKNKVDEPKRTIPINRQRIARSSKK
jgi:hypothetical protein